MKLKAADNSLCMVGLPFIRLCYLVAVPFARDSLKCFFSCSVCLCALSCWCSLGSIPFAISMRNSSRFSLASFKLIQDRHPVAFYRVCCRLAGSNENASICRFPLLEDITLRRLIIDSAVVVFCIGYL